MGTPISEVQPNKSIDQIIVDFSHTLAELQFLCGQQANDDQYWNRELQETHSKKKEGTFNHWSSTATTMIEVGAKTAAAAASIVSPAGSITYTVFNLSAEAAGRLAGIPKEKIEGDRSLFDRKIDLHRTSSGDLDGIMQKTERSMQMALEAAREARKKRGDLDQAILT